MIGTGNATHIRANCSDDHCVRRAGYTRERIQQVHHGLKGGANLLDLCSEAPNRLIEAIDLTSQLSPHQTMMGFDAAIQRFRQLIACAAQAAVGQGCQRLRVSVTGKQGHQHHSP
jgi:hypothetical protein